jgi:hypothetical protein
MKYECKIREFNFSLKLNDHERLHMAETSCFLIISYVLFDLFLNKEFYTPLKLKEIHVIEFQTIECG